MTVVLRTLDMYGPSQSTLRDAITDAEAVLSAGDARMRTEAASELERVIEPYVMADQAFPGAAQLIARAFLRIGQLRHR